ncbi:hypothetical protein QE379_003005 [Sphingomonas sp. SORGH_AS 879]|nr:hypothetical protein [Sphingomonas sp. SORGH_AS_0879]
MTRHPLDDLDVDWTLLAGRDVRLGLSVRISTGDDR